MSKYVMPLTCDLLRPQDGADEERWQLSVASIEEDEGHGVIDVYMTGTESIKIPWQDDELDRWLVDLVEAQYPPDREDERPYVEQLEALSPLQLHPPDSRESGPGTGSAFP